VSIFTEALSYIPPFYKGQPLLGRGGAIHITAVPEFFTSSNKRINPKNLTYNWKMNGESIKDAAGYGKNSVIINNTSYLRESDEISVEVFSNSDGVSGTGSIVIYPNNLKINIYEDSPTLGILFNQALPDVIENPKREIVMVASPFFLSITNPTSNSLETKWFVDGEEIPGVANKNRMVLSGNNGTRFTTSVSMRHRSKLFQRVDRVINVLNTEN
jgi:hypothetical protein